MDVRLPKLGEGAESGTVVGILVKEGDAIAKGQTILELENEKAVAPIPSSVSGKVTAIRVKEGDKISVGHVLITVAEGDEKKTKPQEGRGGDRLVTSAATTEGEKSPQGKSEERPAQESTEAAVESAPGKGGPPPAASPSIRKIARELGLDLARIRGSESRGRLVL